MEIDGKDTVGVGAADAVVEQPPVLSEKELLVSDRSTRDAFLAKITKDTDGSEDAVDEPVEGNQETVSGETPVTPAVDEVATIKAQFEEMKATQAKLDKQYKDSQSFIGTQSTTIAELKKRLAEASQQQMTDPQKLQDLWMNDPKAASELIAKEQAKANETQQLLDAIEYSQKRIKGQAWLTSKHPDYETLLDDMIAKSVEIGDLAPGLAMSVKVDPFQIPEREWFHLANLVKKEKELAGLKLEIQGLKNGIGKAKALPQKLKQAAGSVTIKSSAGAKVDDSEVPNYSMSEIAGMSRDDREKVLKKLGY